MQLSVSSSCGIRIDLIVIIAPRLLIVVLSAGGRSVNRRIALALRNIGVLPQLQEESPTHETTPKKIAERMSAFQGCQTLPSPPHTQLELVRQKSTKNLSSQTCPCLCLLLLNSRTESKTVPGSSRRGLCVVPHRHHRGLSSIMFLCACRQRLSWTRWC